MTKIDGNRVIVSERESNRLLVIDVPNAKVEREISVPFSSPRGLTKLGHCVVVASQDEQKIAFVDLNTNLILDTWDAKQVVPELKSVKKVAVSPQDKTVFLRSSFSPQKENAVVMLQQKDNKVFDQCLI